MVRDIKICLIGASGKMGREIISATTLSQRKDGDRFKVVCGIVAEQGEDLGKSIEGCAGVLTSAFSTLHEDPDVIMDFSSEAGARKSIEIAERTRKPLVIGTTALGADIMSQLINLSSLVPIVQSANMSVGVNIMCELVRSATKLFGKSIDVEITEIHHNTKKDAPSGTALLLSDVVAKERGQVISDVLKPGREGLEGVRPKSEIGVHAIRGGDVPGEHTVYFFSGGERIEITHRALGRRIFANGALHAAAWASNFVSKGGKPGIYNMQDVINLKS